MSEKRIGIIMHGVTGRMGMNQHLIRSILEIRKQGGVALKDGTRVMPDPILVGRNAAKIEELAKKHGVERWTTDLDQALQSKDEDLLRRRLDPAAPEAAQAGDRRRQARLLREAGGDDARRGEGPLRGGEEGAREARRGAGQALAARACSSCRSCATRASSGGSCRCAASSATGCSKATRSTAARRAAPVVELPQAGRRRHHPRHAVPLALRARQPVRRGEGGELPRRHAHSAPLGRERQEVQGHRGRRRLRDLPACRRRRRALQYLVGRARAARRPAHAAGGRHAKAARWPVCAGAWCKATQRRPSRCGTRTSRSRSISSRAGRRCRTRTTTTPSRCSGSCSCKHVAGEGKFRWGLLEGAKGVQLAELGLKSWKQRKWLDVPRLKP